MKSNALSNAKANHHLNITIFEQRPIALDPLPGYELCQLLYIIRIVLVLQTIQFIVRNLKNMLNLSTRIF